MTYITKKEYINWVSTWKAEYKARSTEQRHLRADIKKSMKEGNYQVYSSMQYTRYINKIKLTKMLEERARMKEVAHASYLQDHKELEMA